MQPHLPQDWQSLTENRSFGWMPQAEHLIARTQQHLGFETRLPSRYPMKFVVNERWGFWWSLLPVNMTETLKHDHVFLLKTMLAACLVVALVSKICGDYDGTLILIYPEAYLRAHQYHQSRKPGATETNRLLEAVPKLAMSLHGCLPRKWSKRMSHFPAQSWWWIFSCDSIWYCSGLVICLWMVYIYIYIAYIYIIYN